MPENNMTAAELHVETWGNGAPVLLVHGGVRNGAGTFSEQRPLADRWKLIVVNRRGYHPNPPADREDFEADAADIATLLGDGAHLVGHSYGGVVSLLAAAKRPEAVWSLTVTEPPAFSLVRGHPEVEHFIAELTDLQARGPTDPRQFLAAFVGGVGSSAPLPDPLPPPLAQAALLLMNSRPPWEADIPVAALRAAAFPKLVVSGAHSAVFDLVADALGSAIGASREVVAGAGHSIPQTGAPYNHHLAVLFTAAEAARAR